MCAPCVCLMCVPCVCHVCPMCAPCVCLMCVPMCVCLMPHVRVCPMCVCLRMHVLQLPALLQLCQEYKLVPRYPEVPLTLTVSLIISLIGPELPVTLTQSLLTLTGAQRVSYATASWSSLPGTDAITLFCACRMPPTPHEMLQGQRPPSTPSEHTLCLHLYNTWPARSTCSSPYICSSDSPLITAPSIVQHGP